MEALSERAGEGGSTLAQALAELPALYGTWIDTERKKIKALATRQAPAAIFEGRRLGLRL